MKHEMLVLPCPTQFLRVDKNRPNNASDDHSPTQEEERLATLRFSSIHACWICGFFSGQQKPHSKLYIYKSVSIWRSPSQHLKLWMKEDEVELIESVLVTKMKLLKGVVSCVLFFSLISSRLEVFQICEWLNQDKFETCGPWRKNK